MDLSQDRLRNEWCPGINKGFNISKFRHKFSDMKRKILIKTRNVIIQNQPTWDVTDEFHNLFISELGSFQFLNTQRQRTILIWNPISDSSHQKPYKTNYLLCESYYSTTLIVSQSPKHACRGLSECLSDVYSFVYWKRRTHLQRTYTGITMNVLSIVFYSSHVLYIKELNHWNFRKYFPIDMRVWIVVNSAAEHVNFAKLAFDTKSPS
jgi:hypothetical protein